MGGMRRGLAMVGVLVSVLASPRAQPAQAPAPAAPDSLFYAVAYVEAATMPAGARTALTRYRVASLKQPGCQQVEIFEQIGRPGHFAVFEVWRDQPAFDARDAGLSKALLEAIAVIRTSGHDQRPYKTLTLDSRRTAEPGGAEVIVVSHVDVSPSPAVPPMLRRLADASRKEPGNLRFDVVQHTMRANHFTVVESWRSQQALDAHMAADHTRQYRDEIQPLTGSPLDERVYTRVR